MGKLNMLISKLGWSFLLLMLQIENCLAADTGTDVTERVRTVADTNVFTTITAKLIDTFNHSQTVLYVIGGFGLIAFAFLAIFNKVKWQWLASLSFGLAMIGAAGAIIRYVSQDGVAIKQNGRKVEFADKYKTEVNYVAEERGGTANSRETPDSNRYVNANGRATDSSSDRSVSRSSSVDNGGAGDVINNNRNINRPATRNYGNTRGRTGRTISTR